MLRGRQVFVEGVRRIPGNTIDEILNRRARFREIAVIESVNSRAAHKGFRELLSQLLKQIVTGGSWEVRSVDISSCSF